MSRRADSGASTPEQSSLERVSVGGVDDSFARRVAALGLVDGQGDTEGIAADAAQRLTLLAAWERAGLSLEAIAEAVRAGDLTLAFLGTPALASPSQASSTYQQLAAQRQVPLELLRSLRLALGFAPPAPSDPVSDDDLAFLHLVQAMSAVGASIDACLRLIRVYAHSVRTMAKAEVDLYEAEVEARLRESGLSERELLEHGSELGDRLSASLEAALLALYRRHKQHVWVEHSIHHAEVALEVRGAHQRLSRPPCICFVDLSGFTRLTDKRGDVEAARMARDLAALVEDISREYAGQPVRWLGDGGMFLFGEASRATFAALTIADRAPRVGLPPTHIGIHSGPVIFTDGDVYGRTVNVAARIAGRARPGEVLVSAEIVANAGDPRLAFAAIEAAQLKGVAGPVALYRASFRSDRDD